jgi:hypothetical protein
MEFANRRSQASDTADNEPALGTIALTDAANLSYTAAFSGVEPSAASAGFAIAA